jgi:hypothetical protein
MPKVARIFVPIPDASAASSEKSDSGQFYAVALFSGIGLLISLVAIITGMPGAWY